MTTDAMRDELAKLLGWSDPDVLTSLDTLAAIWREELKGWCWERTGYQWKARSIQRPRGEDIVLWDVFVPDTGDELHDRTALTLAAVKAKKGST